MPRPSPRYRVITDFRSFGLQKDLAIVGHYASVSVKDMLVEHRHPEMLEICYLARGRQVYRVGGKDYALRAGDLFITHPDEQHSTGGRPQERGELYWLQVRLPARGGFLNLRPCDAQPLATQIRSLPRRHFPASPQVASLMRSIVRCANSRPGATGRLELCTLLIDLLLELLRCSRKQMPKREPADLNRILEFISEHAASAMPIAAMAETSGLSQSWFKAKFRRAIGMPPAEYALRLRVERGAAMLRSGASVTQTAMSLGFSSSQYFATVFRKYNGVSPSVFSRQHQTANSRTSSSSRRKSTGLVTCSTKPASRARATSSSMP